MGKRNVGYDFIRIFAIFLVVVIHANVAYLAENQGQAGWYAVMLFTSICLVAVPLFFMVSGALLLDTEKVLPLKTLFKKRILKQAVPFIIWSLIYVVARIVMKKTPLSITAFTDLLHEPAYYQFWFMYSLLAIYLLLPVLQAVVLKLGKKHLEYVLILWLIFSVVFPVMQKFIPGFAISGHVDLILCEGYVGYFLLGHYLKKYQSELSWKKGIWLALIGIGCTGALSAVEYLVCVKMEASYQGYFYQAYLTPFVVCSATGLFLLFQNLPWTQKEKPCKLLGVGSVLTMGVYYVHMLVITALEYVGLMGGASILLLIVKIFLAYGVSLGIAFVISKIPYVRMVLMGIGEKHEN